MISGRRLYGAGVVGMRISIRYEEKGCRPLVAGAPTRSSPLSASRWLRQENRRNTYGTPRLDNRRMTATIPAAT